jgi:hypothetical protein
MEKNNCRFNPITLIEKLNPNRQGKKGGCNSSGCPPTRAGCLQDGKNCRFNPLTLTEKLNPNRQGKKEGCNSSGCPPTRAGCLQEKKIADLTL